MLFSKFFRWSIILPYILISCVLHAQDFEVAPVMLEYNAEPGDNQTKIVNIKNHSNKKVSYIVVLADFLPTMGGDKKILPPNSTKRSCANWVNINPSFFELNAGDEIQLQVNMLVPNDQFNASWCLLYIQPTVEQSAWNADKALGAGVVVSSRIAIRIYQTPKSNTNNSIKIGNLVESTKIGDKKRIFTATIENLGERITKAKVYLLASDMKTAEEKQFKPIDVETFPKMSRTVDLELPDELAPGTYSLAAIIDYGPKYTLEGTQILIQVKEKGVLNPLDTVSSRNKTPMVK